MHTKHGIRSITVRTEEEAEFIWCDLYVELPEATCNFSARLPTQDYTLKELHTAALTAMDSMLQQLMAAEK